MAHDLLHLEKAAKPQRSGFLRVGARNGPSVEELDCTAHPTEVTETPVVLEVERVSQLQQWKHPLLFRVVLDHGRHRLVLVDQRTYPATEATVAAARRAGIDH